MAPARNIVIVQSAKAVARPRVRVHSVCDCMNSIAREHAPRDLRMALGDTIDIFAQVQREARHIESALAREALERDKVDEVTALRLSFSQGACDEIVGEPIVTGFDG